MSRVKLIDHSDKAKEQYHKVFCRLEDRVKRLRQIKKNHRDFHGKRCVCGYVEYTARIEQL